MRRFVFALCLLFVGKMLNAQDAPFNKSNPVFDTLQSELKRATTDEKRIKVLGKLAESLFSTDRKLSDEYSTQQFRIAEESRSRDLIIFAHLSNAQRLYNMNILQENINDGLKAAKKALALSKSSHLPKWEAWSNMYVAQGLRLNAQFDEALNYNNLALSLSSSIEDDSLRCYAHNAIANTYMRKKEKMLAFRNYLAALEIAERTDIFHLLKSTYQNLAALYGSLDDHERAKDYLFKLVAVTKRFDKKIDRVDVYTAIGRVYMQAHQNDMATMYFERAISLADSLQFDLMKLSSYSAMIDMYFNSKQMKKGLEYLKSKPELTRFVSKAGFSHNIDQAYGVMYMVNGRLDSSEFFLKRAEPNFERSGSKPNLFYFYTHMSTLYSLKKDYTKALHYSNKAKAIAETIGDLEFMRTNAKDMDSLYQAIGDFKNAYAFNRKYYAYQDSLDKLSTEKDLLLLEVENENRRELREAQLEDERRRDRHNIQYMGITAAIAGTFILLVMFGIFSVSHATIRILGFFAFIFLFEFIILIADNQIHHWTHGEPWKILAIKIGLISVLLPLHHFLEEKVIHYLTSKKLIEIKKDALLSKFRGKKEVAASEVDTEQ